MLLAILLQVLGAVLVVAALAVWLGLPAALGGAGGIVFAAGLSHELRGER